MLKITPEGIVGFPSKPISFYKEKKLISRLIVPITKRIRAFHSNKYISPAQRIIDIGCGTGYFLRKVKCEEKYGLDKIYGDDFSDIKNFPDNYFDYVTMLAVIEHVEKPVEICQEIARILRPGGKFIFTTPKKTAEFILKFYVKDLKHQHKNYFDSGSVQKLAKLLNFNFVEYKTFMFGLNQIFCLQKRVHSNG